jgi:cysteine-rich repeat protein
MRLRPLFPLAAALLGTALVPACSDGGDDGSSSTSTVSSGGGVSTGGAEGGFGGQGAFGGQGGSGGQGAAGGGFGGQGGSGGSSGQEACPGDPYGMDLGDTLTLGGSTSGWTDDYTSYCGIGTGSGPDAVYAFTPTAAGTMTLSLESMAGLNGVLYAQEVCGDPSINSFLNCQDQGSGIESFAFDAQQGVTYYVFVDGRDQTEGDYALIASLQPGICGDGVINQPLEDCDFGDTNPGDGCDASCQFEAPADSSDTCPGQVYQVTPAMPLVIDSYTTGYTDNYTSCGAITGSPDRVFALFPSANGTMTVTLPNLGVAGGGFDGVLAAWATTCDPSNLNMPPYLGCSDGALASDTEMLTFPVTAGTLYFVVVDGYADYSYGNFELTADLN